MASNLRPLLGLAFLAGTVCALIGVIILTGRWDVPKIVSAPFFLLFLAGIAAYIRTWA